MYFILNRKLLSLDFNKIFLFSVTEYYTKGEVVAKDLDPKEDFKNLPSDIIIVRVKHGSKVRNIMGFVEKSLKVKITLIFNSKTSFMMLVIIYILLVLPNF